MSIQEVAMDSQKGYTAIEALIWTSGTLVVVFLLFSIYLGIRSDNVQTISVAIDAPATNTTQAQATYQKTGHSKIIYIKCAKNDCNSALEEFKQKYNNCKIVPIGSFNVKGQTTGYYFLVGNIS